MDLSPNTVILDSATSDGHQPINLKQLISTIISSSSATCILDPIYMTLLKDTLPLINIFLLDMINSSLITGYVPQSFKEVVIKCLLEKSIHDP